MRLCFVSLSLWFVIGTVATASSQPAESADDSYEFRYHTYAESTAILKNLASRYPRLAKLYSIGKSATGNREVWCIEIGNQDTGPAEHKPATQRGRGPDPQNSHHCSPAGSEPGLLSSFSCSCVSFASPPRTFCQLGWLSKGAIKTIQNTNGLLTWPARN